MEDKGKQDGRTTLREIFTATRANADGELSDGEFRFWMMIRSMESADRGCYAGTEYMMKMLRRSESHVKKVRPTLAKKGWLKVVRRGPKQPELRAVIPVKVVHEHEPLEGHQDELQAKEVQKEVQEEVHSQEHSPIPPIKESSGSSGKHTYMSEFEELWKIHGRGPKVKAATAYQVALKSGVPHNEIVDVLKAYAKTLTNDFGGLHLFNWLRQERWEEEFVVKDEGYNPPTIFEWFPPELKEWEKGK